MEVSTAHLYTYIIILDHIPHQGHIISYAEKRACNSDYACILKVYAYLGLSCVVRVALASPLLEQNQSIG